MVITSISLRRLFSVIENERKPTVENVFWLIVDFGKLCEVL